MGSYTKVAIYQTLNNDLKLKNNALLQLGFPLSEKDRINIVLDSFYTSIDLIHKGKLTTKEFSDKFNNFPESAIPSILTWKNKEGINYYTTAGVFMTEEFKEYLTFFKYSLPDLMVLLFSPDEFENKPGKLKLRGKLDFVVLKERLNEIVKHLKTNNLENSDSEVVDYLYGKKMYENKGFISLVKSAKDDSFLFVNAREIYDLDNPEDGLNNIELATKSISEIRKTVLEELNFKPSWM